MRSRELEFDQLILSFFNLMQHFILDENLPPSLVDVFSMSGLSCQHINALKGRPDQRIVDDQLRRLSIQKGYIIVTRDDDFVKSFVSRKVPEKVVFLYGLSLREDFIKRMQEIAPYLKSWVEQHDFIEIKPDSVRFPFSN